MNTTIHTTGPYRRSNVSIDVSAGSVLDSDDLAGMLVLNVRAGPCSLQTYMTVTDARALAAELAGVAAQVDIAANGVTA